MGIKGTGAFNKEVYKVTASKPTKFLTTLIFPSENSVNVI